MLVPISPSLLPLLGCSTCTSTASQPGFYLPLMLHNIAGNLIMVYPSWCFPGFRIQSKHLTVCYKVQCGLAVGHLSSVSFLPLSPHTAQLGLYGWFAHIRLFTQAGSLSSACGFFFFSFQVRCDFFPHCSKSDCVSFHLP